MHLVQQVENCTLPAMQLFCLNNSNTQTALPQQQQHTDCIAAVQPRQQQHTDCIAAVLPQQQQHTDCIAAVQPQQQQHTDCIAAIPVSYTHLTLPTIYSV